MAEDLGDRTEEATPRRLREARQEGNVARSQDLGSALALGMATLVAWGLGTYLFREGQALMFLLLDLTSFEASNATESAWDSLTHAGWSIIRVLVPFLLLVLVGTWLAQFIQVGWIFSTKPVRFQVDRLDPVRGIRRILGTSGLVRVSLDTLKVIIVISVAVLTIMQYQERVLGLPGLSTREGVAFIGAMMLDLAFRTVGVLLLLGVIDYSWQRWRRRRDLRMTRQQVRDDMKEAEGDPEHRKRRLGLQQQLAMQRVVAVVPRADVIVTNPQHVSVAIAYDPGTMRTPIVISKGVDHLAQRIRNIGHRHGIPVVERPRLARDLHREVEVNHPIPPSCFPEVANVLAQVQRVPGGPLSPQPGVDEAQPA